MSDLISRQDAIDAADIIIKRDTSGSNAVVNAMIAWSEYIRTLPSVEPEKRTEERTGTHACDCISRQAAIAALNCVDEYNGRSIKAIKDLPSVIPQPKTGRWILKHRIHNAVKHYTGQDEMGETHTISVLERYEVDEPYCSECGKLAGDTSQDYCCACGAKMEVSTNE